MRRPTLVLLVAGCAFALAAIMLLSSVLAPTAVEAGTSAQPRGQIIDTPEPPLPTEPPADDGALPTAPPTPHVPIFIVPPANGGASLGALPTAASSDGALPAGPQESGRTLPAASLAAVGGRTLGTGITVAGVLTTPTQKAVYTFSGAAGQDVKITVVTTRGDLDTYLELYGPNYPSGPRLAYNDSNPAAGGLNSQIDRFRLPSSSAYNIVVSSYAGRSTGAFRLTVSPLGQSSPSPSSTPTPRAPSAASRCGGAGALPIGASVVGIINVPTQRCAYSYQGTAGRTVTITLVGTSGNLDTFVELYDPSGARLAYNDNNSAVGGTNSQISRYPVASSGMYNIVVSSYGGKSAGYFVLRVSQP